MKFVLRHDIKIHHEGSHAGMGNKAAEAVLN